MKKIKLSISLLFFGILVVNAQQIGNGYTVTVPNICTPLLTGCYEPSASVASQGGFPGVVTTYQNYLFVMRANNANNNHQMQIGSSFVENDRLFFRKLVNNTTSARNSTWHELATRGKNVFTDNQHISFNKNLILGHETDRTKRLLIKYAEGNASNPAGDAYIYYGGKIYFYNGHENNPIALFNNNGDFIVGWGGAPNNKKNLIVNGTIKANEILVKTNVWADHVFADNYQLPSLSEVKDHIKENRHLPGIPSEKEALEKGVDVGEMQVKLLQKIEELTLYVIQLEEKIEKLEKK